MRIAAAISFAWLAGCASSSAWDRTLTTARSHGWELQVVARLENHYRPSGLFSPGLDQWPVQVGLRARHGSDDVVPLGNLWFYLDGDERAARHLHESLAAESCADSSGRVALRLRGVPAPREHERHEARYAAWDRPWWIVEAFEAAVAPTRVRIAASDCRAALAAAPEPADWARATLGEPMPNFRDPVMRLRTIFVGAPAFPAPRRERAEAVAGAFIAAAHARIHPDAALDFTFRRDGLSSESDFARVGVGDDAEGPFDVFAAERALVRAELARNPSLEAQLWRRIAPDPAEPELAAGGDDAGLETWILSLVEAAAPRRDAADAALSACEGAAARCYPWRAAAIGALVTRLRDASLCARAKSLASELSASTDPSIARAGATLARRATCE